MTKKKTAKKTAAKRVAAKKPRSRVLAMRMSKAERALLQGIADHYEISASAAVRLILRDASQRADEERAEKIRTRSAPLIEAHVNQLVAEKVAAALAGPKTYELREDRPRLVPRSHDFATGMQSLAAAGAPDNVKDSH